MITEVCAPLEVLPEAGFDPAPPEQLGILGRAARQRIEEQRPQRTAQPFVRGDIESDLLAPQN